MTASELVDGIASVVTSLDGLLLGSIGIVIALGVAERIVRWMKGY